MQYCYSAFGLRLESGTPLVCLRQNLFASGRRVALRMGELPEHGKGVPVDEWSADPESEVSQILRLDAGERFVIQYCDGTRFVLGAGEVWCRWQETSSQADAEAYLLGPILSFLLRLQGVVALHASVVEVDGQAIALMGPSGAGKSTLAAVFALCGHRVLADDALAIGRDCTGKLVALPGYDRLRLWPESVRALLGNADALPRITPGWEKRSFDLSAVDAFARHAAPLSGIYLLGGESGFRRMKASRAFLALSGNSHGYRILDAARQAAEFQMLSALMESIPVWEATPPDGFGGLGEFCRRLVLHEREVRSCTALATMAG